MKTNTKKIAVAYTRCNSLHQKNKYNSIEAQEKAIKLYCESNNLDLRYIYCDRAESGKKSNKPEFQRMLKDAENGLFDVCIVHNIDRLARSVYDFTFCKSRLEKKGISLISVTESSVNSEGEAMGFIDIMNQYYTNMVKARIKDDGTVKEVHDIISEYYAEIIKERDKADEYIEEMSVEIGEYYFQWLEKQVKDGNIIIVKNKSTKEWWNDYE